MFKEYCNIREPHRNKFLLVGLEKNQYTNPAGLF